MTNNANNGKPISPHITIYKLQITSVLSIMHRISGAVLFFILLAVSWIMISLTYYRFDTQYAWMLQHNVTKMLLYILSFLFFYHFSTGIRHLVWDSGMMLGMRCVRVTGIICIVNSIAMTFILWKYILN